MTETTQLSLEEHLQDGTEIRDKISNPRFNVGYVALDILKEAGFDIRETSYRKLEAIINRAQETITPQETYTKTEALALLKQIDKLIREAGFRDASIQEMHERCYDSVRKGFDEEALTCSPYGIIYLAIKEALDLPLSASTAPQHTFLKMRYDGGYVNWDQSTYLTEVEMTDEYYANVFNVHPVTRNEVIRELSREEFLSRVYGNIAAVLGHDGKTEEALRQVEAAISLDSKCADLYFLKGLQLFKKKEYDGAMQLFETASTMEPNMIRAYFRIGAIYLGNLDFMKANALAEHGISIAETKLTPQTEQDVQAGYDLRDAIRETKAVYDTQKIEMTRAINLLFGNQRYDASLVTEEAEHVAELYARSNLDVALKYLAEIRNNILEAWRSGAENAPPRSKLTGIEYMAGLLCRFMAERSDDNTQRDLYVKMMEQAFRNALHSSLFTD